MKLKRFLLIAAIVASCLLLSGFGIKVTKTMLKIVMTVASREIKTVCYADSCEKRIAVSYVEKGTPAQVMDIYYAAGASGTVCYKGRSTQLSGVRFRFVCQPGWFYG